MTWPPAAHWRGPESTCGCAAGPPRSFPAPRAASASSSTARRRSRPMRWSSPSSPSERPGCSRPAPGSTGESAAELGTSPIVNLHVVYDRQVLDVPFAAGVHTPVQWVFDRTDSGGLDHGQYLVVSLSAADDELTATADELRARYLPALADLLPAGARGHGRGVLRHPRACGDVPRRPGRPSLASRLADRAARAGAGRMLDRHRLAGHHGGRGAQRPRRRAGGPPTPPRRRRFRAPEHQLAGGRT